MELKEAIVSEQEQTNQNASAAEQAVAQGGAYEVIRNRLAGYGQDLEQNSKGINEARQQEFGSTDMAVLGRLRLRTENNCEAKDLVLVNGYVLFGYNAFLGLRNETTVEDVFGLFKLVESDGQYDVEAVDFKGTFLADQQFVGDFRELYSYYKETVLSQLVVKDGKLLVAFQIGERLSDMRVFRWNISADGKTLEYIDNRGERDIALPPNYDFEWIRCPRQDVIEGRYPHINVLDTLFVDTLRGDLTIKVENNTESGMGLYAEKVDDENQSLDDAEFYYAELGSLILLKIRPYMEQQWRFLVYNRNNQSILRVDEINDSCVQLPEDHGIIFPGGYYLTTGVYKQFEDSIEGLKFKRAIRSPNGEDVLYIFYQPQSNIVALYAYNLINKNLQNPLLGHGFGFFDDGRLVIFYAQEEATRIHPVQIWQTPYFSDIYASKQPEKQSFFGKIGNAELVRGISELYSISRMVSQDDVSAGHYNELSKYCHKIFDNYHWLDDPSLPDIGQILRDIAATSELVLDEYEKVESIRQQSSLALQQAESSQSEIISHLRDDSWHSPEDYIGALDKIRKQRGHLLTIRELRYMDVERIAELEADISEHEARINQLTVEFLANDDSLKSYYDQIDHIASHYGQCKSTTDIQVHLDSLVQMAGGLDLLSELMATLKVPDATIQTQIIEAISEVYSKLNQQKAQVQHQRKSFGAAEATAQFGAQFKLLNQSIHNALGLSTTPDKCDEQLSRLLMQLEELEGQFSEHDEFLADILGKRDEIFETFETHKQQLTDARQRKCNTLFDAATRIMQSISRRTQKFTEPDQLNTFFASDGLISKLRKLADSLRDLDDSVKADDIDARMKAAKEQAIRTLKDKSEIYEEGGNVIKLGPRHKFSVNTQELDITILPRNDNLALHLIGTDFYETIEHEQLNALKPFWALHTPSESDQVYRGEYLAYQMIQAAEQGQDNLSWSALTNACSDEATLLGLIREYAAPRYNDGYEKGIHDHDAGKILIKLIPALEKAGTLKLTSLVRGIAIIYWAEHQQQDSQSLWPGRANNALQMRRLFNSLDAQQQLQQEISGAIATFIDAQEMPCETALSSQIAEYLVLELGEPEFAFSTTKYARQLVEQFSLHLKSLNGWDQYQDSLGKLGNQSGKRWSLSHSWLTAFVDNQQLEQFANFIPEAVALLNCNNNSNNTSNNIKRQDKDVDLQLTIDKLLGDHRNIKSQQLTIVLDEFLQRLEHHCNVIATGYRDFQQTRQRVIDEQRKRLRLEEFKAKPLSSFVRNQLINDVYLPMIGDNLAKQMGTVGANKRTDLMGLLLMISPPGYGKTTLMEYVANRLGLIFMKINCPTVGHEATSIDPSQAAHSGAKQELEKLNLALEMGNNVMLYLDDIQHTNPEFLQQFISLCDGTRRIEGIWKGQSKTYDMRGKKFCVVMSGNPYTESGEAFKIPDMLANRADIYNLGDVLGGKEAVFNMSYIENGLTSNAILAPLATRDMKDVYQLVEMARGTDIAATDLSHQYSGAEIKEITDVLSKLFVIQTVVSKVNQQYIASSAQSDQYRTEPSFKLQGSYRNMNKMAEKVSAVMTETELMQLVGDHYVGEAQLLTAGAEQNLLKLAELRGNMTDEETTRWDMIKKDFMRSKALGGDDSDTGSQIVLKLHDMVELLSQFNTAEPNQSTHNPSFEQLQPLLALLQRSQQDVGGLSQQLDGLKAQATSLLTAPAPSVVTTEPVLTQSIQQTMPDVEQLVATMASTFQGIIESLVKEMQPEQQNKYLAASVSLSGGVKSGK
ncbi:MAG: hypothetical protein ACI8WB_004056 [Phenylobacterium sp.]|jgi:hypothetical protein